MGVTYKPVGQAVAIAKGHYPLRDGRHVSIAPGQTFEIFEGLEKARWFTVLQGAEKPAPVAPPTPPVEPDTLAAAAAVERKRKTAVKPPTADELV